MSSFQSQYGIRLSREAGEMPWSEFCDLLSGLGPETPLGRIVSIRAEEDKEMLRLFTPEQKRIRSQWRTRQARNKAPEDTAAFLAQMQQVFARMAGGGKT